MLATRCAALLDGRCLVCGAGRALQCRWSRGQRGMEQQHVRRQMGHTHRPPHCCLQRQEPNRHEYDEQPIVMSIRQKQPFGLPNWYAVSGTPTAPHRRLPICVTTYAQRISSASAAPRRAMSACNPIMHVRPCWAHGASSCPDRPLSRELLARAGRDYSHVDSDRPRMPTPLLHSAVQAGGQSVTVRRRRASRAGAPRGSGRRSGARTPCSRTPSCSSLASPAHRTEWPPSCGCTVVALLARHKRSGISRNA